MTSSNGENAINIFDLRRRKNGPRRRWTAQEEQELRELYNDGVPIPAIAEKLDRTEAAISQRTLMRGYKRAPVKRQKNVNPFVTRFWSDNEREFLKSEWHKGTSQKEIAAALGRSSTAIKIMRQKMGLPTRYAKYEHKEEIQQLYESGISIDLIARKVGVSTNALSRSLNRRRFKSGLTDDEKNIIEERLHDGCTHGCIARRIGRAHSTVSKYIETAELVDDHQELDSIVQYLMTSGLSPDQIALKLELPRYSILCAIKRVRGKSYGL